MFRPGTFSPALEVVAVADTVDVHLKIPENVWEEFTKFVVDVHGQKYGNLSPEATNAFKEYVDRDRLARVDDKVDELLARFDELDGAHTHKASETVAKTERIADRLRRLDRTVIPADEVRRSIEDVAGADDRTLAKYREQLKRRGLAYEHPTDEVWFVSFERWVEVAEKTVANNPTADLNELLEPYPEGIDEYDRVAEREVLA